MELDRQNLLSLRRIPVSLRAVTAGFLIAAIAGNVWLLLLLTLGVGVGSAVEMLFLALFVWWARGGGVPRSLQMARTNAFRRIDLSAMQWMWGLIAAVFFAATIHAAIVLLFRFVPYPAAAFRHGYDLSFIRSQSLRWVVVVISAASAAVCEETGFRGFMQQPIERRHGVTFAVVVSAFCFMSLHLTKAWALAGMVPIIFGAGLLLGFLAWSAGSLLPGMIGHFIMDVGLFAYWWTGIAGSFEVQPITVTGVDRAFVIAGVAFAASLIVVLLAISRLHKMAQIKSPA